MSAFTPEQHVEITRLIEQRDDESGHGVLIRQLQGVAAGKTIRYGTGTLTWPGGSGFTGTVTVPHGLPGTPAVAVATSTLAAGTVPCVISAVATSSADIQWRGFAADGTSPAAATTKTFYWIAVG